MYNNKMPSHYFNNQITVLSPPKKQFRDVLAWGEGVQNVEVKSLEVEIEGEKGIYYGEFQRNES